MPAASSLFDKFLEARQAEKKNDEKEDKPEAARQKRQPKRFGKPAKKIPPNLTLFEFMDQSS